MEQGLGISIVAETHSLPLYRIGLARPERLDKGRYIYLTYHRLRYHGKGAKEMMDFTKNNILTQAAQAMLAQANTLPQGVLQLRR